MPKIDFKTKTKAMSDSTDFVPKNGVDSSNGFVVPRKKIISHPQG